MDAGFTSALRDPTTAFAVSFLSYATISLDAQVGVRKLSSYQIKINQLHYAPVDSNRSDTSTIVLLCISLLSMHCARLDHRHMARSAPTTSVARGSAQRPNLVQLYGCV